VLDMRDAEPDAVASARVALFLVSTYAGGSPPEGCAWFCRALAEASVDERVGGAHLSRCRVAVFGCGNAQYGGDFNRAARDLDAALAKMGAHRIAPLGVADEDSGEDVGLQFERTAFQSVFATEDKTEGMRARLEKRSAVFKNC
jgi:tRNA wybutosine-synthesizing protein 1